METKLLELSEKLKTLKDTKSELEFELKDINSRIEEISATMIEMMTTSETTSFKHKGTMFTLSITEYPGPEPERKDELWEAMRNHDYGHLFTINSNSLQSNVKEIIANNKGVLPEWLEGLIKISEKATIKVTRSKKTN